MAKIKINPDILKWAREESGYLAEDISSKLQVSLDRYLSWEKSGDDVPFGKLKLISKSYKRQIAIFFLPTVPEKIKKPSDFRNLSAINIPLSKKINLAIRRVRKYQKLLRDIYGDQYFENKYKWLKEYKEKYIKENDTDKIAYWLRDKIKYNINEQIEDKTNEIAYKKWRNAFERILGIFIFQFSLPSQEVQGFNFSDEIPFCIAINSKNFSINSRIFTLFHEFSHILQRQSCLCLPDNVTEDQHDEFIINSMASSILLPSDQIIFSEDPDEIFKLSKKFKVSSEVYLRRLKSLNLISNNKFFHLVDIIRANVKPQRKVKAFGSPIQRCINSKGHLFFDAVVNAANNNIISYNRASDALEIKVNYILSE